MAPATAVIDASLDFNGDPRVLLRKFTWVGLLCLVAILVTATYGIFRVFSWQLKKRIEENAPGICQVVMIKDKKSLISVDAAGRTTLKLPAADRPLFDKRLRNYLESFAADSMRVYDLDYRIIYETFNQKAGESGQRIPELAAALSGTTAHRLEKNVLAPDLEGNLQGPADQVVSYIPIWGRNRRVLGAFEIRKSLGPYRHEIARQVAFSALVLGGVLIALFGCIYIMVKKGTERLARAQEILHFLATTDPLTGVFNRREVLVKADASFSRRGRDSNNRSNHVFGCLMLDFDDFKNINDRHGHHVGDRVLQELATRLKSTLRPYDIVGRFGGEEFLVVMPETTSEQCRDIAERLGRAVREKPFVVDNLEIECSISIGGATAHPFDKDVASIIQRADEGLYQAKRLGKDCAAWC
ncbi:MAG: GGDEF domain-containing protein [Syntrophotaleaceae bacterium]